MISKKIVNIIQITIFISIRIFLFYIIPIKIRDILLIECLLDFISFFVSYYLIIVLNKRIFSNFLNNFYSMISNDQYEDSLQYVDKAIECNPKNLWLRIERANLFAYSGKIVNFYSSYNLLLQEEKIQKCWNYYRLEITKQIVDFLNKQPYRAIDEELIKNKIWKKNVTPNFNNVLLSLSMFNLNKYDEAFYYANLVNDSKICLLNYFSNVLKYLSIKNMPERKDCENICYEEIINCFLFKYYDGWLQDGE